MTDQELGLTNLKQDMQIEDIFENNSLEVDPITLDAYSYMQEVHPELLFLDEANLKPTPEELKKFTNYHSKRYQTLARDLYDHNSWEVLLVGSGMYGGKSTLSFYLLDYFQEKGYNPVVLIADIMEENSVTGRSYTGPGEGIRDAIKYGSEPLDLGNDNVIILLDEFSFLPSSEPVKRLIDDCKNRGRKLVLTGLNSNYLGYPLPTFEDVKEAADLNPHCHSFIPGQQEEEPTGTSTIRYVKIGNYWVYDIGILPLVVSKEKEDIVHYCPARQEHTFVEIFSELPTIRDHILNPSEELEALQARRLNVLSPTKVS
jgi:hypothetical protein